MTIQAIGFIELSTNQSSIVISQIPQVFDDLLIVSSIRGAAYAGVLLNSSNANTSSRLLWGFGNGTIWSATYSSSPYNIFQAIGMSSETASTFGNAQIYIPNYRSSIGKTIAMEAVTENNAAAAYHILTSASWNNSAAVNTVSFHSLDGNLNNSGTFVAGSTVTIYGITRGSDGVTTVS